MTDGGGRLFSAGRITGYVPTRLWVGSRFIKTSGGSSPVRSGGVRNLTGLVRRCWK